MLKIVNYPSLSLFQQSIEVTEFDDKLHNFLDEMKFAMLHARGLGLAANQVSNIQRLFIMLSQSPFKGTSREVIEFINPIIIERSKNKIQISEGCLSAPGITLQIPRHEEIVVQFQDRYGTIKTGVLQGIEAICVQHEIDHLDGIFFFDKASPLEKQAAHLVLGLK